MQTGVEGWVREVQERSGYLGKERGGRKPVRNKNETDSIVLFYSVVNDQRTSNA